MLPRFVILDFDGTLADSLPWFVSVLDDVGRRWRIKTVEESEHATLRQLKATEIFRRLEVPGWKLPLIAADIRRRMARDIDLIALFDGVGEQLLRLHGAGVGLGMVSSNSAANIRRVLGPRLWGLISYWECGVGVSAKHGRLTRLLQRAGVAREHAIYIGDEVRDIDAARRAGMAVGAVTWGYNDASVLRRHGPDLLFERVEDISARLLRYQR
jgi:phosphoglycolate phosphatase